MILLSLQELLQIVDQCRTLLQSSVKFAKHDKDWIDLNLNLALRQINKLLVQKESL